MITMFVAGRGPMCVVAFRFEETPSREEVEGRLRDALGVALYDDAIDSVELGADSPTRSDQLLWVLSQDLVALTYARRVCCEMGGARVSLDDEPISNAEAPSWTRLPWRDHSWTTRLRIRFGRLSL